MLPCEDKKGKCWEETLATSENKWEETCKVLKGRDEDT